MIKLFFVQEVCVMTILEMNNKHLEEKIRAVTPKELSAEITDLKFIGGGSFGKVFKLILKDGRTVAVKAFRRQGANKEEALQLQALSANTSVKMPEVLFTYNDDSVALMGMSFIEGKNALNLSFLLKSNSQKKQFAEAVIDGMNEWHSIKGEYYGFLDGERYSTWLECYKKEKQEPWLKGLTELAEKGKFSKKKLELLLEATKLFDELYEEPDCPVLIHADLNIMNIMADPKTLELTGFIDPCGAMWADREYDLFQLRNMWGDCFGLYEEYKKRNRLSAKADFKVAYYGALHEASCRLQGGLIMPLWEELCNIRLRKAMKNLKK